MSKNVLPLNKIPFLALAPIPEKYDNGILNTRAQGQLITKKVALLYAYSYMLDGLTNEGILNINSANANTAGV